MLAEHEFKKHKSKKADMIQAKAEFLFWYTGEWIMEKNGGFKNVSTSYHDFVQPISAFKHNKG